MFNQLIVIGNDLEAGLRELFSESRFSKIVRGVSIDVDNYWEHMELRERFKDTNYLSYLWYRHNHDFDEVDSLWQFLRLELLSINIDVKLNYRPPDWQEYCQQKGYPKEAQPIRIIVSLYEDQYIDYRELPRSFRNNYPIIYEKRSANKAINNFDPIYWFKRGLRWLQRKPANCALAIKRFNPSTTGTAGGILQGSYSGLPYLISCAHVMGPVGTEIYEQFGKRRRLGHVVYHKIPQLCYDPESSCSDETDADLRSVDVAVAELTVPIDRLKKAGVIVTPSSISKARDLRQNLIVSFTGKESGKIYARIGALTLWNKVSFKDGERCFGRIFELNPVKSQYIRKELAQQGDSGSLVVLEIENLIKWCGVVLSCDGDKVYACFADYLTADWTKDLPEPLRCYP